LPVTAGTGARYPPATRFATLPCHSRIQLPLGLTSHETLFRTPYNAVHGRTKPPYRAVEAEARERALAQDAARQRLEDEAAKAREEAEKAREREAAEAARAREEAEEKKRKEARTTLLLTLR